jgi:hypothetical protein
MKNSVLISLASFATPVAFVVFPVLAGVSVRTVDFLAGQGLSVNAAGPVLLRVDDARNRLIVANTLTSSVTAVDCASNAVRNIPVGARALQHLKAEALTLNARIGDFYLIGTQCLIVAHPDANRAETIPTAAQFESVALDQKAYAVETIETKKEPLGVCVAAGNVFVITRAGNTLERVTGERMAKKIPYDPAPDNVFEWGGRVVITSHDAAALYLIEFDPKTNKFALLHKENYPFGETRFDSGNVSLYVRGQFGDAVFSITEGRTDKDGRPWTTDCLAGKAFILER